MTVKSNVQFQQGTDCRRRRADETSRSELLQLTTDELELQCTRTDTDTTNSLTHTDRS